MLTRWIKRDSRNGRCVSCESALRLTRFSIKELNCLIGQRHRNRIACGVKRDSRNPLPQVKRVDHSARLALIGDKVACSIRSDELRLCGMEGHRDHRPLTVMQ